MVKEQSNHPTQAAIDTTTGRVADLLFTTKVPPHSWVTRCLGTLVDTVINHSQVIYLLPSREVAERVEERGEEWFLPESFVEGEKRGLLGVKTDITADEVQLPFDLLASEYRIFSSWAEQNALDLAWWLEYYKVPRHIRIRNVMVPRYLLDDFWATHGDEGLSSRIGVTLDELRFTFEFFIRGIRYHHVIGETIPYFAHPVRDRALGFLPIQAHHQMQWSWGKYFTQLFEREKAPRDIRWLLDRLCSIRDLTRKYNATWYTLSQRNRQTQVEILSTIASESDLPATVKDSTQRALKAALAIGAAASSPIPVVSIILSLGLVAVEYWSGTVPGRLGKIPAFKGHLEWPVLLRPVRSKLPCRRGRVTALPTTKARAQYRRKSLGL